MPTIMKDCYHECRHIGALTYTFRNFMVVGCGKAEYMHSSWFTALGLWQNFKMGIRSKDEPYANQWVLLIACDWCSVGIHR